MSPPRRIAPPPTRFAIGSGQPRLVPARSSLPTGTRQPPLLPPRAAPSGQALQRMEASDAPSQRPRSSSAPPALGTNNFARTKRVVIRCTMGQGVIGNLGRVVLMSDDFSSCSPVVLFNAQTGMGGLFHFAAKNWKQEQTAALKAIYQAIRPTVIYLCDRTVASDLLFVGLEKSTDHLRQKKFFREHCGFAGKIKMLALKSERYYVTLATDGSVSISSASQAVHLDVSSDEWKSVKASPLSTLAAGYAIEGVAKFGRNLW